MHDPVVVGVLALQGAFHEHIDLLKQAANNVGRSDIAWSFREVRTPDDLQACRALIIPGGESTTIALVAARSGLLEPLRNFVKVERKPVWGTCAGLILLAESANRTKKGGQDLIGGLDIGVNRNHFGRQTESFEAALTLPFLRNSGGGLVNGLDPESFPGVFIRAPVVRKLLPRQTGEQEDEAALADTVVAPSKLSENPTFEPSEVEILATLPGREDQLFQENAEPSLEEHHGDVIVVRQGNVFGTSFHPELTNDPRIHVWWLKAILESERK